MLEERHLHGLIDLLRERHHRKPQLEAPGVDFHDEQAGDVKLVPEEKILQIDNRVILHGGGKQRDDHAPHLLVASLGNVGTEPLVRHEPVGHPSHATDNPSHPAALRLLPLHLRHLHPQDHRFPQPGGDRPLWQAHSVHAEDAACFPDGLLEYVEEKGVHVGICHGMQLLVQRRDGEVRVAAEQEYRRMEIFVEGEDGLFGLGQIGGKQTVWMSHRDEAARLPEGFEVIAKSRQGAVAAIQNRAKRFYGLQYHPGVVVDVEMPPPRMSKILTCSAPFG